MSKTTVGAGAVVALTAVLAIGAVAYDTGETPAGHEFSSVPGAYYWAVTFEYPDGETDTNFAFAYYGTDEYWRGVLDNDYRLTADKYPNPPDGYEWDHPPEWRYTEDTVVKAIPTA